MAEILHYANFVQISMLFMTSEKNNFPVFHLTLNIMIIKVTFV